jgi:hypothetical protein
MKTKERNLKNDMSTETNTMEMDIFINEKLFFLSLSELIVFGQTKILPERYTIKI